MCSDAIKEFQKYQDEFAKIIYKKLLKKDAKLSFVLYVGLDEGNATTDETLCPLKIDDESLFGDVFTSFKPFRINAFEKELKKIEGDDFELTVEVVSKHFPTGMTLTYSSDQKTPVIRFQSSL